MKRSSVREHVIISYLEHRVEITARALKKAKGSRIKGAIPKAQRTYRLAVAKLAAARPAA
jgi:hypothetical protein